MASQVTSFVRRTKKDVPFVSPCKFFVDEVSVYNILHGLGALWLLFYCNMEYGNG